MRRADALRLDRLLANLGFGSRSEVQRMIASGAVCVDGVVERNEARKVGAEQVTVDGAPLEYARGITVAMHKPLGVVCSHDRREGTRAYDLVPSQWEFRNPRVETIGRLDKDTSGLVILTDDHQLLHRLSSPKHHVSKRYEATLTDRCSDDMIQRFASGALMLQGESKPCLAAAVEVVDGADGRLVSITLSEGRYHQVRRMVAACGNHVETLRRTHFGAIELGDIAEGSWREIDPSTIDPSAIDAR